MSFERYFESEFGLAHPPLFAGTFTAAREAAHRESRYLVAILWSREHDNARAMGRVLAHPTVVAYLSQPRFLVWAGDLATSSTYGTSLGLHATAFPLLSVFGAATVPYMPTPFGPRVRAKLMQIARMDGLPTPDEMLAPESAAYDEHVHGEYLARTLIRLIDRPVARHGLAISAARRGQQERAEEQRLRQQQDVAYEASLARDRQRELEAQARAEKEQADRDEAERLQREEQHARDLQRQWRWATLARIVREECEDAGLAPDGVGKLSLRLESGRRVVQSFPGDATLQRVFDFVETRETADEWARTGTTPFGSDLSAVQPPARYEHSYEFALVSQFPRVVLDDRAAPLKATLAAKGLWPSAALIVEPLYESESDSDGHDSNTAGA
ncbi:Ubx domain-containing protein [Coemansia biformis]|uniref:Ubx domain-containing protein n=1 Tax=Coemansia biformis TaxID=1286918 RepID=A0A9W7Y2U9_9FUNG|nr:Ubx domain-containing protein [Coemansia biformis]